MQGADGGRMAVSASDSCDAIQTLLDINAMIDIHSKHLEGLRTQCSTSAELIQQEIRTIEGKLVKLFSKQLVNKEKIPADELPAEVKNIPSIKQWLQVVGISQTSVEILRAKFQSLQVLQEMPDYEIRNIFSETDAKDEELRRLFRALQNLRRYTEVLLQSDKDENVGRTTPDLTLYWDSWDSATRVQPHPSTTVVASHNDLQRTSAAISTPSNTGHPVVEQLYTPPHTPSILKGAATMRFPATPPARKKNQVAASVQLLAEFPLTKSTSHESQLGNRVDCSENASVSSSLLLTRFRRTKPSKAYWLGRSMEHLTAGASSPSSVVISPAPVASTVTGAGRARHRLVTDPGQMAASTGDQQHVVRDGEGDHLPKSAVATPKSPRTPTIGGPPVMVHAISHRFTMTFKMLTDCDLCQKQMFIGLKCKECKYKCHRDCASKVPPSCKLPPEYIDFFRQRMSDGPTTPILSRNNPPQTPLQQQQQTGGSVMSVSSLSMIRLTPQDKKKSRTQPAMHVGGSLTSALGFGLGAVHLDSSSTNSSCSSSTPSSPAPSHLLMAVASQNATPPSSTSQHTQFRFPEVTTGRAQSVEALTPLQASAVAALVGTDPTNMHSTPGASTRSGPVIATTAEIASQKSTDSQKTVSFSGLSGTSGSNSTSTDSERTYRVDSQDSQMSDTEAAGERHWPRQNSLSLREWDIPFQELELGDVIGQGRFGTVHRGNWHGDVAIRLLFMDQVGDEKVLESFKHEVATFRKTRHENLVLFMGACMNLPTLALVTSMCKGLTLYKHLHLRKDKFSMNKTVIIAQQISQGMGYLHARGIVHKDLKSKNIFLENGKVIITDFGLFSVSKLCKNNGRSDALNIPPGWLCYLAPELMRSLKPSSEDNDQLPFTMASDVYSFGTVWYELLCGEWPFKEHSPEAMIWQIGCGMKQSLANLQASRDLKDILMACWAFDADSRTEFSKLLKILERLPRKRLVRSPSHPIHLSRSAESVF